MRYQLKRFYVWWSVCTSSSTQASNIINETKSLHQCISRGPQLFDDVRIHYENHSGNYYEIRSGIHPTYIRMLVTCITIQVTTCDLYSDLFSDLLRWSRKITLIDLLVRFWWGGYVCRRVPLYTIRTISFKRVDTLILTVCKVIKKIRYVSCSIRNRKKNQLAVREKIFWDWYFPFREV